VYVPVAKLLMVEGLQLPVIPLVDVAGKIGGSEPEQTDGIALKVGVIWVLTVTVNVVTTAH
jgi:hypothetical protein